MAWYDDIASGIQNVLTGGASGAARDQIGQNAHNLEDIRQTNQTGYDATAPMTAESRANQTGAIDALRGAALGTAPSQAVETLKNAAGINASQASSLAAGQHGVNPLLALNQATTAQSQGNAALGGQAAAARAGEMATARGQFAAATAQQRAEDEARRRAAMQAILQSMGLAGQIPGQQLAVGDQAMKGLGALTGGLSGMLSPSGGAAGAPAAGSLVGGDGTLAGGALMAV